MPADQNPAVLANSLLQGPFKRSSKNKSCEALAKRLGVHPKTVAMISNGGYCGAKTARKLALLVSQPGARRDRKQDRPRIYVPMENEFDHQLVLDHTTAEQRRAALLALARQSAAPDPRR